MAGKRPDFEAAARAAYPTLSRAAQVLCRSRSDAEDAVQETLLRAWKSYGAFRGESSPTTWMYVILTRVISSSNAKDAPLPPAKYSESLGEAPAADSRSIAGEEAHAVTDAIRSLPPRQREIVTLRYLEGLSYAEVAKALGVSAGAVKASMFKAKMSMRAALAARGVERRSANVVP